MSLSSAQLSDTTANGKSRAQHRARSHIAAAKRNGVYLTADDISAAWE